MKNCRWINSRNALRVALTAFVVCCARFSLGQRNTTVQQVDSAADLRGNLQALVTFSPDPCDSPFGIDQDFSDVESAIFRAMTDEVTRALNANLTASKSAKDRAIESLEALRKMSAEVNASWPEENRFQFELLDLSPALVLKVTIRTRGRYFVFAVPAEDDSGKPNRAWRIVGSDDEDESGNNRFGRLLDVYPLHRGASGNPRFLAKFINGGCAGSIGVSYDAREWVPQGLGSFDQIIKQTGAFGLDDKVPGFPQIGQLQTKGPTITLPYCWFSAIDTWDNPSMCAVDTYDLSGDTVRFRIRTYNRPDLLPIAKALEYAEQRDYPAVLAYCATAQVARSLVREVPPFIVAEDLKVTRIGTDAESVEFGSAPAYRFQVAKRGGRWVVTTFSPN